MLRENKGVKQDDVAEAIGIFRAAYSHYENDRNVPTLNNMKSLAAYYDIPLEKLVNLACMDYEDEAAQEDIPGDYLGFLKECADMNSKDLAKWMTVEDRELVYYYHKLSEHDKSVLIKLAKTMAE